MKIVAIDEFAQTFGGISWKSMEELGELKLMNCTDEEEVSDAIFDANIVLSSNMPLSAQAIEKARHLSMIQVMGTGFNHVDLNAARSKSITVCNVPDYSSVMVAQQTFALILEIYSRVGACNAGVKNGGWKSDEEGSSIGYLNELWQKTIGIVGYGSIGKKVAEIASAFGMKIVYTKRARLKNEPENVTFVSLNELYEQSDIISLHCPLNAETQQMINKTSIAKMKDNAILINTARGGLVNERDLSEALKNGQLMGAGLDVLCIEPPQGSNPLVPLKNCIISPHMGAASKEARQRMMDEAVINVKSFLAKKPRNIVE